MSNHIVVTIGRQYGSGGLEIGKRLGELLGCPVYDHELLNMAAEKKGMPPDYLRRVDEKATGSLLYTLAMGATHHRNLHTGIQMSINDRLFIAQTEVIKEVAENGPAVFIGRCADYVLRNHKGRVSFFLHADMESRIAYVCEKNNVSRKEAEELILKNDKRRINYYNFYTGGKWGKCDSYHLTVNTAFLGIEGTAQMLAEVVRSYQRTLF